MTAPLFDWARWNGRSERTPATSTTGDPPLWERYKAFVAANPHVLEEALRLARKRMAEGQKRIGAKALWEELRESIRVKKLGSYKLNNSFTALLARDLISHEPRLVGVIELRERRTAMDKAVDEAAKMGENTGMRIETKDLGDGFVLVVLDNGPGNIAARYEARLEITGGITKQCFSGFGFDPDEAKREVAAFLFGIAEKIEA